MESVSMNAKNLAWGTFLGLTVVAGAAVAEPADKFAGFNLSLGATAQSSTFKSRETGDGTWTDGSGSYSGNFSYDRQVEWPNSAAKFGATMDLGYNIKASDNFLLGVSLTGDFVKLLSGKTKIANANSLGCNGVPASSGTDTTNQVTCDPGNYVPGQPGQPAGQAQGATNTATMTLRGNPDFESNQMTVKNRYGIVLRPMLVLSENTAIFLKASYNQASASGFGPELKVRGPGYGFGFESNLTEHVFLRAEIERIDYSGNTYDQAATFAGAGATNTPSINPSLSSTYSRGDMAVDSKVTAGTIAIGVRF